MEKTSLNRSMQVIALALIVALPFDNALFHLFSFLLLFSFSRTFFPRRSGELKMVIASGQMGAYIPFGYMWATMLITNLLNEQFEEAWRTMLQFGPRYWLLFTIFAYLLHFQIIAKKELL